LRGLFPEHPAEAASLLYGTYTALVYATPFFGGIIADRYLGQRRTVVVGAVLMAVGHFVMAIESAFFIALLLLIVGNGAFKPNVSTQVGSLYPEGDPRRDGAFTLFYMGINLGAFICNFVCGTLAAIYGWHYGFGAAGFGMLLGLGVYLWGQRYLAPDHLTLRRQRAAESPAPLDEK
jgi:POT family proton-dependent oligopeptide transporter